MGHRVGLRTFNGNSRNIIDFLFETILLFVNSDTQAGFSSVLHATHSSYHSFTLRKCSNAETY